MKTKSNQNNIDRSEVLAAIDQIIKHLEKCANQPISAPQPLLSYRGRELVIPGTITTIRCKAGSHKAILRKRWSLDYFKGHTKSLKRFGHKSRFNRQILGKNN